MTATRQKPTTTTTTTTEAPDDPSILDRILQHAPTQKADSIARRYCEALAETGLGRLTRAMVLAEGIEELRKAITPQMMSRVMALMNSPLGFKTDRGPGKPIATPYSEEQVKDCLISALLSGVYPTNNEFNIIKENMFVALNGWWRKIRETKGISDLRPAPGVPTLHNGKTVVRFGATWKYRGVHDSLRDAEGKPGRVFEIPVKGSAEPDAIVGKATRRALKAIWEQIHGSEHTPPDGEVGDTDLPAFTRTEQVVSRLEAQLGTKPNGNGLPAALEAIRKELELQELSSDSALAFLPADVERFEDLTVEQAQVVLASLQTQREAEAAGT